MSSRPSQPPGPSALATRYVLHAPLSTSATSTVYAAVDRRLERSVVITLFHRGHARSEEERRRLVQVAMKIAAIDHPHLMPLIELGVTREGVVFLVTPRGEGRTLRELAGDGPMAWRRAVELARQLLAAVGAMHERGVVHGDLSPEKCQVTSDGGLDHLRLCDFGPLVSRHLAGASAYRAPEQLRGEAADARADVFAVGVILHQLVTGRLSVAGDSLGQVPPLPLLAATLAVPGDIMRVLHRALATAPTDRYASAGAFAAALADGRRSSEKDRVHGAHSVSCSAARAALAAWTRFEYALARREARRASASDPAWLPLHLLMSCLPEAEPDIDRR